MSLRSGLLGLAGVLALGGVAAAKPPDLPAEVVPDGREPDPVARDFYLPDGPARVVADRPPAGPRLAEVVEVIRGWLTLPLGLVLPPAE